MRRDRPDIALTPSASVTEVVEALVNASPWCDPDGPDGGATQFDAFRVRTRAVVGTRIGGIARAAVDAASKLARAPPADGRMRNLESVGIAFDQRGATTTVVTRDGRRIETGVRKDRGMER